MDDLKYREIRLDRGGNWSRLIPTYSGRLVRVSDSRREEIEGRLNVKGNDGYNPSDCYRIETGEDSSVVLRYDDIGRFEVNDAVEETDS